MMDSTSASAQKLKTIYKEQWVKTHPITDHPLAIKDLHVQDLYFTLLCVLVNLDQAANENQQGFLNRLLLGVHNNQELSDYFKKSVVIDTAYPEQFIEAFHQDDLKYNLLVDLLMVFALADQQTEEQIEIISETALVLDLTIEEVRNCAKIAKAVMEQNNKQIKELSGTKDNLLSFFPCYLQDFYEGILSYNDILIDCFGNPTKKTSFTSFLDERKQREIKEDSFAAAIQMNFSDDVESSIKNILTFHSKEVVFRNYVLSKEDIQLVIENCTTVTFYACDFQDLSITPLVLNHCHHVLFDHCTFDHIDGRTMILNDCDHIEIRHCHYNTVAHHRVIDFKDAQDVSIEHNTFHKISFRQLSEGIFTIDQWPNRFVVANNVFSNCKNTSGFGPLMLFSGAETAPHTVVAIENNRFEHCFAKSIIACEYLTSQQYRENEIDNAIKLMD